MTILYAAIALLIGCADQSPLGTDGVPGLEEEGERRAQAVSPASLAVWPSEASAGPGDSISFAAELLDPEGRAVEGDIVWEATGGSIDAAGRFVAGEMPGDFHVVARLESVPGSPGGEVADTARVAVEERRGVPIDAVTIAPGERIQRTVDRHPAGTTFLLRSGRHVGQTVRPRDGNVFIAEPGAVLDGEDRTEFAFLGSARDVVLQGLEITGYVAHDSTLGALNLWEARDWRLEALNVHRNRAHGANLRTRITVVGGSFSHNGRMGIVVAEGGDVVIDGVELAYNNPDRRFDPLWHAGGIKIARSTGVVVRNSHVHHNVGPGIWYDIDANDAVTVDNLVEHNTHAGIFFEISSGARIEGNTVRGNGTRQSNIFGAGILISTAADAVVRKNTVLDNAHGIVGLQKRRGAYATRGLRVEENTVRMDRGGTGLVDQDGDGAVFGDGNLFDRNSYHLAGGARPFLAAGGAVSVEAWRAAGQDLLSSFHRD